MTHVEILEEIKKMNVSERLRVIEATLYLMGEDLKLVENLAGIVERKSQLTRAAKELFADYTAGGELTIFTSLDSLDFHAKG